MSDKIQQENQKRAEEQEQYNATGAASDIGHTVKDVKDIKNNVKGMIDQHKAKKAGGTGTPAAPNVPTAPGAPAAPNVPTAPGAPAAPNVSTAPGAPAMAGDAVVPDLPSTPSAPSAPSSLSNAGQVGTQSATNTVASTSGTTASGTAASGTAASGTAASGAAGSGAAGSGAAGSGAAASGGTASGAAASGATASGAAASGATASGAAASGATASGAAASGATASGAAASGAAAGGAAGGGAAAGGAAAGASTAGPVGWVVAAVIVAVTVVRKVVKKVETKLEEKGHDVKGDKKRAVGTGILATIGISMIWFLIIVIIIYLVVHQDSKTYDTVAVLNGYIECAEGATDCVDYMGTGDTVKARNKRLIQFSLSARREWHPFEVDEVTELVNDYVSFISRKSIDDEAINFGFLDIDDIASDLNLDDIVGTTIDTEEEKKIFNFKRQTMKTYLMMSSTAFNNIKWYIVGPKDKTEINMADISKWTSEENVRELTEMEHPDEPHHITFNTTYMYDLEQAEFEELGAVLSGETTVMKKFYTRRGTEYESPVRSGLRIPSIKHFGITEEQYISILEPMLPAWIEPFSIYTATGDWELSQRLYDFYKKGLGENPYQVYLYTIPTVERQRIYNPRTFKSDVIIGYEQKYNEEIDDYEDDLTKPIYATEIYYGKKPDGVEPVAGEIYSIDDPDEIIETMTCTYTAVVKKGYSYKFHVDTEWAIEAADVLEGEPIITPWTVEEKKELGVDFAPEKLTGGRAIATDIHNYYLKPIDEIEQKYTYTNKSGEEEELRNRFEWYIMTNNAAGYAKRKELEELGDEELLKTFEENGICEDNTEPGGGEEPCGEIAYIEPFDYSIDDVGYAIQRSNEYYERVEKEVSYSVDGVSSSAGAYLGYSGLASGTFAWPVPESKKITNCFGMYESGGSHKGVDISNMGKGSGVLKVVASADGVVEKVVTGCTIKDGACSDSPSEEGKSCGGRYGNHVRINHGNGYVAIYAHLASVSISEGNNVKAGDEIGIMGSTGNSCGAHLHFELRKDGKQIDPTNGLMYGIPAGAAQGKKCQDTVVYQDMPTASGGIPADMIGSGAYSILVRHIREAYGGIIKKYSTMYGLDPNLVVAVIAQESSGEVLSDTGRSIGLMQWEYAKNGTALKVKKADGTSETISGITRETLRNNADFQIKVGCAALKNKSDEFYGNTLVALQGYNYGSGGIRRCISYHISGHTNTNKMYCGIDQATYINYVKSGDTGWLHDTEWYSATGCTAFGSRDDYHGDSKYVKHILDYYDPEGL